MDEDTRDRSGNKEIVREVLSKIEECDIFLADVTPVITLIDESGEELPKHMPNSKVLYEHGYAQHCKGEGRIITLAKLEKGQYRQCMPFDINHNTLTTFKNESGLKHLADWIRNIVNVVEKERAEYVPEYACTLLFYNGKDFTDETTIYPRYKRIFYSAKTTKCTDSVEEPAKSSMTELLSNSFKLQQALIDRMNVVPTSSATIKVVNKTTKLSYSPIQLIFVNQGGTALDNLQISIRPDVGNVTFDDTNVEERMGFPRIKREYDTSAGEYGIFQKADTLNPHASIRFDEVFIHAPHDIGSFKLHWELSSRTFQYRGDLTVHVKPEYEDNYIENDELAGSEKVEDMEVYE